MRLAPFLIASLLGSALATAALWCHPAGAAPGLRSRDVVVHPNGSIELAGRQLARLNMPPPPRRLEVQRHHMGTRCLLHVKVIGGPDGRAAELLTECAAGSPLVFAGNTGPQGRDGEWSRTLALEQQRVLLFESRPEVYLCRTRQPARLYLREFDFETHRFRPVAAFGFPSKLPRIIAQKRAPRRGGWSMVLTRPPFNRFRVVALSSARDAAPTAAHLPAPTPLQDRDPTSVWRPAPASVDAQPLLIARRPTAPYPLRGIVLTLAGAPQRAPSGNTSGHQTIMLLTASNQRFRIVLPAPPASQRRKGPRRYWIRLPAPIATSCVALVSDHPPTLSPAPTSPRLHIAELQFVTEMDLNPRPIDALFTDLTHAAPPSARAARGLLLRHPEATLSEVERRMPSVPPESIPLYLSVMQRLPSPRSARLFAEAVPRLPIAKRAQAAAQLVAMGPVAVEAIAAVIAAGPTNVAVEIIAALRMRTTPTAAATLLSTLALDDMGTRRAARDALHGWPPQQLCPLLARLPGSLGLATTRRSEVLSLLPRCCASMPTAMRDTANTLMAPTWPKSATFALRYALVRASSCLPPRAQIRLLRAAMSSTQPPLRTLATQQLMRPGLPADNTTRLLLRALTDPSPGVRRAAADVARHPKTTTSSSLRVTLAQAAESERWPFVARALAHALGRHCSTVGNRALRRMAHNSEPGPDRAALAALARCADPDHLKLALRIATDPRQRADLREAALASIPPDRAQRHHEQLVRLHRELRQHIHTEGDLQVAAACTQLLAHAGPGPAIEALIDTLGSDPQQALRTAAAAALGKTCTREGTIALRRAAIRSAHPVTARVASSSLGRCGFAAGAQGDSEPVRKR